ncbi:uncharacterized protein B0I36DRAFT_326314 [Microdochium trichocladiopsis]|uniref:Uncharacterized protein n=1 Tax=Microdochium trichocladiopsis TaxID=1682393 RepID=A0A9P9BPY2_9PEZI|nr:uncharacterized protein B0I36DRAFT_326314 [Microdochium trichocladiopsis]KAH7029754.1 hypothetical protein B0I36DRAFT_326314 [Microdochium trichocladiopsis]
MRFTQLTTGVLLSLAVGAAAVDVELLFNGCTLGGSATCVGLNPNQCCYVPGALNLWGVNFRAMPSEWNLELRFHRAQGESNQCGDIIIKVPSKGSNFQCLGTMHGDGGGAGYGFLNWKREDQPEQPCQQANLLTTEDGVVYDLDGLSEKQIVELVGYMGANSTGFPGHFDRYRI